MSDAARGRLDLFALSRQGLDGVMTFTTMLKSARPTMKYAKRMVGEGAYSSKINRMIRA